MKHTFAIVMALLTVTTGGLLLAQAPRSAEAQFKAAQQKEEVEGDLKGAIEEYRKVVAGAGTNRPLAARALVRMAECHQKLGDTESRKIYQRVLREFADQNEPVAIARARLGRNASAPGTGIVTRQVWANANAVSLGSVSPDGRYVSLHDWNTGDLLLRDLSNGEDRRLTDSRNSDDYPGGSTFGPDGKQVAYAWGHKPTVTSCVWSV